MVPAWFWTAHAGHHKGGGLTQEELVTDPWLFPPRWHSRHSGEVVGDTMGKTALQCSYFSSRSGGDCARLRVGGLFGLVRVSLTRACCVLHGLLSFLVPHCLCCASCGVVGPCVVAVSLNTSQHNKMHELLCVDRRSCLCNRSHWNQAQD